MTPDRDDRSLAALVSDLVQQLSALVQTEGNLLQNLTSREREQDQRRRYRRAHRRLLIAALVILRQSLVHALATTGMGPGWAALTAGPRSWP